MLTAKQLMTRGVSTASPDWTVAQLANFLSEEGVHGVPVVDDDSCLVGIVSTRDIASAFGDSGELDEHGEAMFGVLDASKRWEPLVSHLASGDFPQAQSKVSEIMSRDPVTATEDCTAGKLAKLMLEQGIHRVVILGGREIVGIVSATDLLGALVEYEKELA